MSARSGAWLRLLLDAALELVTGSRRDLCAAPLADLRCERRENHRGRHAVVDDDTAAVWGPG